jgi:hypothetical protein
VEWKWYINAGAGYDIIYYNRGDEMIVQGTELII